LTQHERIYERTQHERFREVVNYLQRNYGLRKGEIAKSLGKSATYISDMSSGKIQDISPSVTELLFLKFGVNPQWLIEDEGPMIAKSPRLPYLSKDAQEKSLLSAFNQLIPNFRKTVLSLAIDLLDLQQAIDDPLLSALFPPDEPDEQEDNSDGS